MGLAMVGSVSRRTSRLISGAGGFACALLVLLPIPVDSKTDGVGRVLCDERLPATINAGETGRHRLIGTTTRSRTC
jgi:hypothetical protein